jgi:S1-C subfamily serine protease
MAMPPRPRLALLAVISLLTACTLPDLAIQPMPVPKLVQDVNARRTLAISAPPAKIAQMVGSRALPGQGQTDPLFVGVAVPVSAQGHFLTAHHVAFAKEGHDLGLVYYSPSGLRFGKAEVLWSDKATDLALVRAPIDTPSFYRLSPANRDLPEGTPIVHAGMTTGSKGELGHLVDRVRGGGGQLFEHTLHLQPGDSGGPVLLASGELLAVNSSLGYYGVLDTKFYHGSRSARPPVNLIERLIAKGGAAR